MEKVEQLKKYESVRDVEQDRLAFVEAIKNIEISEIDTEFDEKSAESLISELANSKLLLLGETHGVKENVDIIYTFFKKFGFKKLALEWNPELREQAEKFLQTGELDFEGIKNSADGRITTGHFALLKKLKDEGLLEALVCFDEQPLSDEWNARDANMAKNILANLSGDTTLAVAGKLHTKVEPFTLDGKKEEEYHPMGENVKKQITNVPSGRIEYRAGQYYNFGAKDFEERSKEIELPKARFYKSDDGVYSFELPEAHVAIIPNPSEVLSDEEENGYQSTDLSPERRLQIAEQRSAESGYKSEIINEALVIGRNPSKLSVEEINKIINFVKPIGYWELTGHCTQRTAESVFSGVAEYGWERLPFTENTGVIPMGLHMISGKKLKDGSYIAFDTVSRAVILSKSESDTNPLAQVIIFYGNSEGDVQYILSRFYGGEFKKQEILDTPYDRFVAQRKKR